MEIFLTKIIRTNQTCIFISPHLDDAILSTGELMRFLSKNTKVIVINVFTEASDEKQTLSARKFVTDMGYKKATDLFKERQAEDTRALKKLHISPINLGFSDVLWRKKRGFIVNLLGYILPEFQHVYPTYRFHITKGNIAKADQPIVEAITKKLEEIIKKEKNPLIFCPLGIGKHVDHIIVHEICKKNFSHVTYWSDFPYNIRENYFGDTPEGYTKSTYGVVMKEKRELIEEYKTQTPGLFLDSFIPDHNEVFFIDLGTNSL